MSENQSENATAEPLHQYVCERVREMRKKKGWTLQQLASMSGVSRSMLSQIERGEANPTLAVAYRIAQAFGMTIGELTDFPSPRPRIDVVRHDDSAYLFRNDEVCRIRTLSPLHLEKEVEFYELTLRPGGTLSSSPHYRGAREVLTIQQGAAKITSGEETSELQQGDSAHYPADVPHAIQNLADQDTIAFLVVIYHDGAGR
jgi:transcriptional regulator with XRE-family HTH domain